MRIFLVLLLMLLVAGCDAVIGDPICTGEFVPGLRVSVRDADTGEPAAFEALGIARDAGFADTLGTYDEVPPEPGDLDLLGAWERAGRYDVTISKAGYQTWRRENVRVTEDECHVRTVELEALLERE
ncbi:MAG: carboxypeptidase-like regulatory domain-containing protein [Bacteroidota bacterium]